MRFLVDECTGVAVARWLRNHNQEVFSVYEQAREMKDQEIIEKCFAESWILITNDKDFGEKVYREKYPHKGVIFLRLANERSSNKIEVIRNLLDNYAQRLSNNFVVVTETQVRFARR